MSFDGPSSGDFAWSQSQSNGTQIQDCFVLIGWLSERVRYLEEMLNIRMGEQPTLPSRIDGFGCIPARQELVEKSLRDIEFPYGR